MVKKLVDSFWHSVAFLTRLPVPKTLDQAAFAFSSLWYPVVGLLLGAILSILAFLLHFRLPSLVLSMVVVSAWVYLTGGLHLDGLMDTADGFGSQRSRERVLEIMKDSRVGAMGVLAALVLLGNKVAALAALQGTAQIAGLLLAPLVGRTAMYIGFTFFPYARAEGLANSLQLPLRIRWWPIAGAFLLNVLLCLVFGHVKVLLVLVAPVCSSWWLIRLSLKKIGGLTGDVYGALCETAETAVLLSLVIGGNWMWS